MGAHVGRPIVVIGGGPSAPRQWGAVAAHLHQPVRISANGHAFKLGTGADYIFCKDHRSTETHQLMEPALREHGVPLISRHYWADFRAVYWPVSGNSGMMAVALAALMGGSPIIPIGFDSYQNGTYFHNLAITNVSLGRSPGHWQMRYKRMRDSLAGAVVRPVDGPLADVYPRFDPAEALPPAEIPAAFAPYRTMRTHCVRFTAATTEQYDRRVTIPAGEIMAVNADECRRFMREGVAELIGDPPALPGEA